MNTCFEKNARSATRRALFAAIVVASASALPASAFTAEKLSWYGDPGAPNLSGVWVRVAPAGKAAAAPSSKEGWLPWPPPLKAPFDATWKQRLADDAAGKRTDDPVRGCLPPGMPRFMSGTNGGMLIIQTPGRVMVYRDSAPVRRIWLDASVMPAPKDLESFSNGNAVGRYEGKELVTDVRGIKDQPIDGTGVPHSDELTIVERFRRIDAATLQVTITLTDPAAYAVPMTSTITYSASNDPRWEPREFICTPVRNYHPEVYVR